MWFHSQIIRFGAAPYSQLIWFEKCLVCGFDDLCLQVATGNTPGFSGEKPELNNPGWKLFNALFPRTLESFARRLTLCPIFTCMSAVRESLAIQGSSIISPGFLCSPGTRCSIGLIPRCSQLLINARSSSIKVLAVRFRLRLLIMYS